MDSGGISGHAALIYGKLGLLDLISGHFLKGLPEGMRLEQQSRLQQGHDQENSMPPAGISGSRVDAASWSRWSGS
jgi:hypothetical protein